ncbi:lysophospholipid acyltransferase family protein [Couchioplanes azureus]|uniref:lysophospholipid acyltransferase family protein n=1 Tax=Couchioplanes caeruleus TaxID=56438 RepID=UPI00167163A4|nr:lysophospholipid acyltransferase family protein [Couchioplanes caeruleus]
MTWQPVSSCGPRCRPGGDDAVGGLATVLRLGAVAAVLAGGLVLVPLLRGGAVRRVARGLLAALGVRLVWRGPVPKPGSLLVANHISWLDVLALLAVAPVTLVAKREVGTWPAVGRIARSAGAIFVDRDRPRRLPETVAEVTAALRAGRSVAVFPEGTTFCGAEGGRFRPAVFQAAVDARAAVVPISIRYGSPSASFIGDDTLWASVRRVAALRDLTVTLVGAPALRPEPGADRRSLARAAQASAGVRATTFDLAA